MVRDNSTFCHKKSSNVIKCYQISSYVMKCHHVKWEAFWWFWDLFGDNNLMTFVYIFWWCLVTFLAIFCMNYQKSFNLTWWHFMTCHDMSCLSNQFAEVILFQIMARSYVKLSEFFKNCGMNTLCHMIKGSGTLSILKCP